MGCVIFDFVVVHPFVCKLERRVNAVRVVGPGEAEGHVEVGMLVDRVEKPPTGTVEGFPANGRQQHDKFVAAHSEDVVLAEVLGEQRRRLAVNLGHSVGRVEEHQVERLRQLLDRPPPVAQQQSGFLLRAAGLDVSPDRVHRLSGAVGEHGELRAP